MHANQISVSIRVVWTAMANMHHKKRNSEYTYQIDFIRKYQIIDQ